MPEGHESTVAASPLIAGWRTQQSGVKKLPRGRHGIPRSEIERSQRGRAYRACLVELGLNGSVNVSAIVREASISRKAFYELFASCEECIAGALATANVILGDEMLAAIERADHTDPLYKIRVIAGEFCQMAAEEPEIAVAIAGTTYSLNHATRQVWLDVLQARYAIVSAYWDEARMRDSALAPTTPDRITAANRFLEGRVLEEIAAGRAASLPDVADSIADSFIEIVGG